MTEENIQLPDTPPTWIIDQRTTVIIATNDGRVISGDAMMDDGKRLLLRRMHWGMPWTHFVFVDWANISKFVVTDRSAEDGHIAGLDQFCEIETRGIEEAVNAKETP